MQTNETLLLRTLSQEEVSEIYHTHTVYDFPKTELKPLSSMLQLLQAGDYLCYGLFENENLRAYAYFFVNRDILMLDYFAVCRQFRCGGYGSRFLSLLKQVCSNIRGILLEVESPDCAQNQEEWSIRNRRVHFYQRNGVLKTQVTSRAFGVEYDIMYLPCKEICSDEQVREELLSVYRKMISPEAFATKLLVRRPGMPRDCV